MSDFSRSEVERGIVQSDERVEIAAIHQAEVPISEPVQTEDGGREFSADLSSVMSPGEVVVSDAPAPSEEYVEFHVERGGPGQPFVGVPDDEAATRGPVAVDRAPDDDEFQTATVRGDDNASEDAGRRADFEERQRTQREADLSQRLAEKKRELEIAKVSQAARDLERRARMR